jgi:repressor LexA
MEVFMALTEKQQKVLDFIQGYSLQEGEAPSQREIAEHFGFKSLGTVQDYLKALQARGCLEKAFYSKRNLSVVQSEGDRLLPLLGKVAAGQPIEYTMHDNNIEVPTSMLKSGSEHFALKVVGDSMVDIGILENDYVVVRKQSEAENGRVVVAMINNEATIKRMFKKSGIVELHSENAKYKPIFVKPDQEFRVLGIFVGLIRLN